MFAGLRYVFRHRLGQAALPSYAEALVARARQGFAQEVPRAAWWNKAVSKAQKPGGNLAGKDPAPRTDPLCAMPAGWPCICLSARESRRASSRGVPRRSMVGSDGGPNARRRAALLLHADSDETVGTKSSCSLSHIARQQQHGERNRRMPRAFHVTRPARDRSASGIHCHPSAFRAD